MRRTIVLLLGLALLALTLGVPGCESTDLTADPDGELRLSAIPETVQINPGQGQTTGTSTIQALVLDADDAPMSGANVTFFASNGQLASSSGGQPRAVETGSDGIARDVLTIRDSDPSSIEVTATSGALSQNVTVEKTIFGQPVAEISADPADEQLEGELVTFSGAGSSDPDGSITCYQWHVDSDINRNDRFFQGQALSIIPLTFTEPQSLTVSLLVSDRTNADSFCTEFRPPAGTTSVPASAANFSPNTDEVDYDIVCGLVGPTADAGDPQTVDRDQPVTLNGSATAGDAPIDTYSWNCGNSTPSQNGPTATCTYQNATGSVRTFTAVLTVTDECGLSDQDTVVITVRP